MSHDSETAEAYDPTETDLGRIIEIAGFYQAVGGKPYVKLGNRALAPLDLSRQLELGRAILVGKTASTGPAITVEKDTRDDRIDAPVAVEANTTLTQWRFVIPVSKP